MGPHYSELTRRRDFILSNIEQEETRFSQTLTNGLALLDEMIADLKARARRLSPVRKRFGSTIPTASRWT